MRLDPELHTQSKQLDLLKNVGFTSPSWEDLVLLVLGLVVGVALCGAAWTLWDRRQDDPWLRLLHRVRVRLQCAGIEVPPQAPPRHIATVVTRFGPSAQPLAEWLLRLESQRYAHAPPVSLPALRRELNRFPWPEPDATPRSAWARQPWPRAMAVIELGREVRQAFGPPAAPVAEPPLPAPAPEPAAVPAEPLAPIPEPLAPIPEPLAPIPSRCRRPPAAVEPPPDPASS
jgi:hypothetical protein